jgi:hypothetical protein
MQASEGESESSQGTSDEEERGANTAPSATTSSGPNSFASRNAGSVRGKDKEDREEEEEEKEEEEGQGDDEKKEEDEQPPPPPKNTRKKSKRGRQSR